MVCQGIWEIINLAVVDSWLSVQYIKRESGYHTPSCPSPRLSWCLTWHTTEGINESFSPYQWRNLEFALFLQNRDTLHYISTPLK